MSSSDWSIGALRQIVNKGAVYCFPEDYIRSLGLEPFDWQIEALSPVNEADRLLLLAARQSGKTTIVAGGTGHTAKYTENALNLILCPSRDQSAEVMEKVAVNMSRDRELTAMLTRDGRTAKEYSNFSRIVALPGTERSVRGYSAPRRIILDEAARLLDATYMAVRPMMTGVETDLLAMTTAFGKRGWFYRAWTTSKNWRKIMIRVPWDPVNGKLVPAMPEDEYRDLWRELGISSYYSSRHNKRQLQEDLDEMGDVWFRQEYCCEFLEDGGSLFSYDDIMAAFTYEQDQADARRELYRSLEEEWAEDLMEDSTEQPLEIV